MSAVNSSTQNERERRQYYRVDMKEELIDIIWKDSTGNEHQKKITCLDFSRGGVKASCDQNIPVNTEATVIFKAAAPNSQRLDGRILRSIKQACGSFQIALQLSY